MKTAFWRLTATAALLFTGRVLAGVLYYDGQDNTSSYINTTNNPTTLTYFYPGSEDVMQVSGGKRVVTGSGDPDGNDYFYLNPTTGDSWDQAGLYDSASDTIGGGDVEGVMFLSFLVRAHQPASAESERKSGELPYGRYFGIDLMRDGAGLMGIGNGWDQHAYSLYGSVSGGQDLKDSTGLAETWITVNTDIHLMVARIAFHANAADDISVWLDPDPQDGNTQSNDVLRYIGTANGDMSFNRIAYRAGNIPTINAVDFDEVRFGTSWEDVTPVLQRNTPIWYDGQKASSTFINTSYDATGLTYTMANGQPLPVEGGKRVTPGTGDTGTDTFTLVSGPESSWQDVGLYDNASGLIGGGNISGVLFFGALVRAQNGVSGTTEAKSGDPVGTEAYVQLTRPGLNNRGAIGMGNAWNAWAYSISGVFGDGDLVQESGGTTYVAYNTNVHMMVGKIVFNANAADTVTVWLDPNPDNEDSQISTIRRATRSGDLSFSQISYRSGNLGTPSMWEFDEVRFATSWQGVVTNMPPIEYPVGTIILIN